MTHTPAEEMAAMALTIANLLDTNSALLQALRALVVHVSGPPDGHLTQMADQKIRLKWYAELHPIRLKAYQAIAKATN